MIQTFPFRQTRYHSVDSGARVPAFELNQVMCSFLILDCMFEIEIVHDGALSLD